MSVEAILEGMPAMFGLGAGGGFGYFVVKWFIEWLGGRVDKKEEVVEKGFQALDKRTQDLLDRFESEIKEIRGRLDRTEADLRDCKARHAESEAEVLKLKAIMQGAGEVKDHVQRILAAERLIGGKDNA